MAIKLNVPERINLISILPKEGNFIDLGIIRGLNDNLNFSEKDIKNFGIKTKDNNFSWNRLGEEESEFDIGERGFALICNILEDLDKKKKLDINHFTLFEKFLKQKE